ncbi:Fe2+-dependent dioxygenase [Halioglobus maricola]|uniref:Fe2+-dependent dioxygenase n=1 Tax=Halioglobus maricola TaxID=2601894 RepID=A0A5P9NG01_9GAMM|nr:Fe2+-dependent dioxygenase [Halioglobus maricola]QFU74730.1 Fe2+-dependent dioxygenase [Halioglobus maricola]
MVIIEQLLTKAEVADYRRQLDLVSFVDGGETAEGMAADVKRNGQADATDPAVVQLANELLGRMGSTPQLVSAALPHRIFPPCFNRYVEGETYGYHVDASIMRVPATRDVLRSDVSMTLFLSEMDEYEGGELHIATDFGHQSVKLEAGAAVVYPSSSLHRVTPVSAGVRMAAICWMQSLVADEGLLRTLYQLDRTIQSLSADAKVSREQLDSLHNVYHNLVRKHAQV